jgi:hypothetical protein
MVLDAAALVVNGAIRRRNDQDAVRREHAAKFREHLLLLAQVLDGLERHDEIDARGGQRQLGHRADGEPQIGLRVALLRMGDGVRGDVHTCHRGRVMREQIAAVAFAARCVEHALAGRQRRHGGIAVPVLVPDRSAHVRHEPLAGERECCVGGIG